MTHTPVIIPELSPATRFFFGSLLQCRFLLHQLRVKPRLLETQLVVLRFECTLFILQRVHVLLVEQHLHLRSKI